MQQVKSTMGGVMPSTAIPGAAASASGWHRGHTWGRCAQTVGLQHSLWDSGTPGTSPGKGRNGACLSRTLLQGCKHLPEEDMLLVGTWQRRKGETGQPAPKESPVSAAPLCPAHIPPARGVTALTPQPHIRIGSLQTSWPREAAAEDCNHGAVTLVLISLKAPCTTLNVLREILIPQIQQSSFLGCSLSCQKFLFCLFKRRTLHLFLTNTAYTV